MSNDETLNLRKLVSACEDIAREAGDILMHYYEHGAKVSTKSDATPVTEADKAADNFIASELIQLSPSLPVLSEEQQPPDYQTRKTWPRYWLVDPMDGTKEFIKRSGEFSVNIALIEHRQPILGVVYAPAKGLLWFASRDNVATKVDKDNVRTKIQARALDSEATTAILGHASYSKTDQKILDSIKAKECLRMGSSMKICAIAEGKADIYPRLGKTSEWDTAAAQCILERAGGKITDLDMEVLSYNQKESLLNPEFFAFGQSDHDWSQYLN